MTAFNEEEFWVTFLDDVKAARARVIIHSPFLASRRLRFLSNHFVGLINRGIVVCVFFQEPRNLGQSVETLDPQSICQLKEIESNVQLLRSWGVHVNARENIHAKFVVIDDSILWEGSLNVLSHSSSKEHMRRWYDKIEIESTIMKYALSACSVCHANYRLYAVSDDFGKLLARQRINRRLSKREFAESCGLGHSRLSQIEGGRNTTLRTFLRCTEQLGLKVLLVPDVLVPAVTDFLQHASSSPDSGPSISDCHLPSLGSFL